MSASKFYEWIQVGINEFIPHKYQVKPHPFLWFSSACAAALIHRNHFLGISLPVFPRTNLKLHNISVTPKMVQKVIANLDSSKVSGLDCIPVVVLKNCEPELSHILAELFNMYLKKSCFPDCWKVWLVVPAFKNVRKRSIAKNYNPDSLLSVFSKVFERLVVNLQKCGLVLFWK